MLMTLILIADSSVSAVANLNVSEVLCASLAGTLLVLSSSLICFPCVLFFCLLFCLGPVLSAGRSGCYPQRRHAFWFLRQCALDEYSHG